MGSNMTYPETFADVKWSFLTWKDETSTDFKRPTHVTNIPDFSSMESFDFITKVKKRTLEMNYYL